MIVHVWRVVAREIQPIGERTLFDDFIFEQRPAFHSTRAIGTMHRIRRDDIVPS